MYIYILPHVNCKILVFFVPGKYKERLFRWRGGFSVSFHVEIFLLGEPKANPEEDRNVKTN